MNRQYRVKGIVVITLTLIISACVQRGGDAFFAVERYEVAADLYIEAAENGDVDKMIRLAEMYTAGKIDYQRDFIKAVYWYQKASAAGRVGAMFELGFIFEYGQGSVDQDSNLAIHWYKQAAIQGHAYSQYRLASILSQQLERYNSDGAVLAYSWFLIAANSAQACAESSECRIVSDDLFNHQWRLQQRLSNRQQQQAGELAMNWQPQAVE